MDIAEISRFIRDRAMSDPEFARAIRYFTGALRVDIDGKAIAFQFDDGKLTRELTEIPESAEIHIDGTQEHWNEMLAEYPGPFFQCLQTTSIKHGLLLNNTATFYAYLPALNRLVALLRAENNLERKVA